MKYSKKEIGDLGEDIACKYLLKKKYRIIIRNFQKRYGEIDIIARNSNDILVFFEVKTRTSNRYGTGAEAVGYYKQKRLVKTAYFYLNENKIRYDNFRIDVLSIDLDFRKRISRITHFRNAVEDSI